LRTWAVVGAYTNVCGASSEQFISAIADCADHVAMAWGGELFAPPPESTGILKQGEA
jgi:hypothetical protein